MLRDIVLLVPISHVGVIPLSLGITERSQPPTPGTVGQHICAFLGLNKVRVARQHLQLLTSDFVFSQHGSSIAEERHMEGACKAGDG